VVFCHVRKFSVVAENATSEKFLAWHFLPRQEIFWRGVVDRLMHEGQWLVSIVSDNVDGWN
jgi:hypothetical protein